MTTRIIETRNIDDKGHGHLTVVEGLGNKLTIICNIYAPVRGLSNKQVEFYERLVALIDELENKYVLHEPDLIILGDFNIPFEVEMSKNMSEKARARTLFEYFNSLGVVDCWKPNDNRITLKGGHSRLDRILYRLQGDFVESLDTDWTFTVSDHCLLSLCLKPEGGQACRTRRVTSLPTYILSIKEDKIKIAQGLEEFKQMIDENWSASTKLEFMKTGLRTVVGECIKARNKREREELDSIQTELEQKMICNRTISLRAREENMRDIDILFNRRNQILEDKCESLALKAKTKWFHEGEKASKFFLNILRRKGTITNIDTLMTENGMTTDAAKIKDEVSRFYKELYEEDRTLDVDNDFYQYIDKVPPAKSIILIHKMLFKEAYLDTDRPLTSSSNCLPTW